MQNILVMDLNNDYNSDGKTTFTNSRRHTSDYNWVNEGIAFSSNSFRNTNVTGGGKENKYKIL